MTLPRQPGSEAGEPYVVCLDCGGKFAYDWREMRMGARIEATSSGDSRVSRMFLGKSE